MRLLYLSALVCLYIPIFYLILRSFGVFSGALSFQAYSRLFENETYIWGFLQSLRVGIFAALIGTAIGFLAAWGIVRWPFRGAGVFERVSLLPLFLPEVVIGVCLLLWFSYLDLQSGFTTLLLSHLVLVTPYCIFTLKTRIQQLSRVEESAALDLGANSIQVFARIHLPQMVPAILATVLLSLTLSLDDFLVSYFTAGVDTQTLPLILYSGLHGGNTNELNAIAVVALSISFLFSGVGLWRLKILPRE